jgi:hypothetical protein
MRDDSLSPRNMGIKMKETNLISAYEIMAERNKLTKGVPVSPIRIPSLGSIRPEVDIHYKPNPGAVISKRNAICPQITVSKIEAILLTNLQKN